LLGTASLNLRHTGLLGTCIESNTEEKKYLLEASRLEEARRRPALIFVY